jgi:hypothetical protein
MQLRGALDHVRVNDDVNLLRDIAKASRAEYDKSVRFAFGRRRRLPAVARELIELARDRKQQYIPPLWRMLAARKRLSADDEQRVEEWQAWELKGSYRRPSPRWAAELPEPRSRPGTLQYVEQPAHALTAKCKRLEQPRRLLRATWRDARRPRSCKLSTAPPLTKEFLEAMSCDEPRCVIYGVSMR